MRRILILILLFLPVLAFSQVKIDSIPKLTEVDTTTRFPTIHGPEGAKRWKYFTGKEVRTFSAADIINRAYVPDTTGSHSVEDDYGNFIRSTVDYNIYYCDYGGTCKIVTTGGGTESIFKVENTSTNATAGSTNNYHHGNIGIGDFSSNTIGGTFHAYAANMQMILSDSCSTDSCATPQLLLRRGYNTTDLGRIGFLSTTDPHFYFRNSLSAGRLIFQTDAVTKMQLLASGQLSLDYYGDTTFTGTAVKYLAVTDAGLVIEADGGGATISELTPNGTADSQGGQGDIAYDDSYLYVKTGVGWKRTALTEFGEQDTIKLYSPVLYVHADSISGTSDGVAISSWPDLTANSTDFSQGTGGNQPVFRSSGINGKGAIDFDGTDDVMTSSTVSFTSDVVTIAAAIHFDNVPAATAQDFFSKANADQQFWTGINSSLILRTAVENGAGTASGYVSDTTVTTSTYIVVFSIDAVNNEANIYVNGTLKATVTGTSAITDIRDASYEYNLGAFYNGGFSNFFNGRIGALAVYDAELTTSQMLNISTYLNNQYGAY